MLDHDEMRKILRALCKTNLTAKAKELGYSKQRIHYVMYAEGNFPIDIANAMGYDAGFKKRKKE